MIICKSCNGFGETMSHVLVGIGPQTALGIIECESCGGEGSFTLREVAEQTVDEWMRGLSAASHACEMSDLDYRELVLSVEAALERVG